MDISVITPFYKGNAYMEQLFSCIRKNALAAPELKIELVLVNDSPDHTVNYDAAWVEGFTLKLLCNEKNSGIHLARVNGLAQAEGTFIQFLDQDDLLEEDALASQFALSQDADVVIANGFDQNPKTYGPIYPTVAYQQQATRPHFYYAVANMIVSPGHCLIRKDAIPALWLQEHLQNNGSDDLLLWLLMFHEQRRFVINPRQLYTHVDTGENVSANDHKILDSSAEVLTFLQRHGCADPKQLQQFARSRRMGRIHANRPKAFLLLSMLCYPDVAWHKLALMRYKRNKSS